MTVDPRLAATSFALMIAVEGLDLCGQCADELHDAVFAEASLQRARWRWWWCSRREMLVDVYDCAGVVSAVRTSRCARDEIQDQLARWRRGQA